MDTTNATRIKLLKLWELLCSETDSEHPMSTTDIIRRLSEDGIFLTRKTLYRDIATLNENGFEVLCDKSQANLYYVASRTFELSELHILMDALQAAAFIPERKTAALISKVAGLSGNRTAELLKRNVVRFNVLKTTNEAILYRPSPFPSPTVFANTHITRSKPYASKIVWRHPSDKCIPSKFSAIVFRINSAHARFAR